MKTSYLVTILFKCLGQTQEFNIDKNTVGERVRRLRKEEEELKTKNQNEKLNEKTKPETFIDKDKNIPNSKLENEDYSEKEVDIPLHYNF